jgi:hypothetical protein
MRADMVARRERGGNCHKRPHRRKAKGQTCATECQADNAAMTRMGDTDKKPEKTGSRSKRLAAALRENLRRRKAQERGREAPPAPNDHKNR